MQLSNTELILIRITGEDRPGLTASVTEILAKYDATILDIGQADIHNTLSLGILCMTEEQNSGFIMKELLFKASSLGVTIRFYPISTEEYESWVKMQGKNRYILTLLGRKLSARQIAAIRCASGSFIGRSLLYCPAVLHGPYIEIVYLIFTRTARAIMKIILRWMLQIPFTKRSKHAIIIVHLRETRGTDEESCCGRRSLCQKGAGAPGHRPAENRISGCSLHAGLRQLPRARQAAAGSPRADRKVP